MTKVAIERVKDVLYCHYAGQTKSQPVDITLNCETGVLSMDYAANIGNCTPMNVFYNRALEWTVPLLKPETANSLLEEIKPYAQQIVDGFESVWDGSNHVGEFTEEAYQAERTIDDIVAAVESDVSVWDAIDWYLNAMSSADVCAELGITAETTIEEIEKIAEFEEANADDGTGNIIILNDVEKALTRFRDELIEEKEYENA